MTDDPSTMTCGQAVVEEFQSDRAGLGYIRPADFVTPQWPFRKRPFLLYRVIMALVLNAWLLGDVAYETQQFYSGAIWRWFVFATNWSFLLLALSAILQAVTSCIYSWKSHWIIDPQYCRSMPVILQLQWALLNLAYNSALVVTTAYWVYIVFIEDELLLKTTMSEIKHTANTVYVVLDLLTIGAPIRVFHMFFTITLGSCYAIFNAVYFLNNGPTAMGGHEEGGRHLAYNFLSWHKPVEAIITCVLAMFLCVLGQCVLFLLFRLRVCVWQKVYGGLEGRMDSEMQNIVMSTSASYNTIDETMEEKKVLEKMPGGK